MFLVNSRFGRLVVMSPAAASGGHRRLVCRCDCGTVRSFRETHLMAGATKSCGCLMREAASTRLRRHGKTKTPEYGIWKTMKSRCGNRNTQSYVNYGGRGITVCDRWKNSFEAFLLDMGERPSRAHSIDRRDGTKGYSPDNCRWATPMEQAANSTKPRVLTMNGVSDSIAGWARRTGLTSATIDLRLRNRGWSVERALTTPRRITVRG